MQFVRTAASWEEITKDIMYSPGPSLESAFFPSVIPARNDGRVKILKWVLEKHFLENMSRKFYSQPIQARTRNLSTGENVQKWTSYFLLFSDASERRV